MSEQLPQYLTEQEIASRLRWSPASLRVLRCRRQGPPWHKIGRSVRYREDEVAAWIADQQNGGAA